MALAPEKQARVLQALRVLGKNDFEKLLDSMA